MFLCLLRVFGFFCFVVCLALGVCLYHFGFETVFGCGVLFVVGLCVPALV